VRHGIALTAVFVLNTSCRSPVAPPPPPPPPENTLPIAALRSLPVRVEAGETLEISAEVQDAETPLDQLFYTWVSTLGGAFTPVNENPRHVSWVAPDALPPASLEFMLLVTERFMYQGASRSQEVSARSSVVHYNDSRADVTRIATRFITELFPDFTVTPAQAVQDFSDSCPGKRRELRDVEGNRLNFRILSGTFSNIAVTLNADRTRAAVTGACAFRDIPNPGQPNAGRIQRVEGTCNLTAIYEEWNWRLCDSNFDPPFSRTRESLRYRVPGLGW
jgi:hypothetical protein